MNMNERSHWIKINKAHKKSLEAFRNAVENAPCILIYINQIGRSIPITPKILLEYSHGYSTEFLNKYIIHENGDVTVGDFIRHDNQSPTNLK